MRRPRARLAAALLLAPALAAARDVSVETPALDVPARPLGLQVVAPLTLPLATAPGLSAGGGALRAPQAAVPAAAPAAPPAASAAAPALPASAVPAAASRASARAPRSAAASASGAGAGASADGPGLESDAFSGGALFDKALARGEALTAFASSKGGSPAARRYEAAMDAAERADWKTGGAEASAAALALLAERGVKAERVVVESAGRKYEAVTVAAVKGVSPLNDLAFELQRFAGGSLDFIPERTAGASGAWNAKERRLMLAGLDRPDFYLAALHEARHAWYSALLKRGEIRLFHFQVVARPGRLVSPGAETYASYVSLEELSTFPKTLKHMLTERAKQDAEGAAYLEERLGTRALQLADILRTADYLARQLRGLDARGGLEPRAMSAHEVAGTGLDPAPGMAYFELPLPQGWAYFQVPIRSRRRFFKTTQGPSRAEARAALRLRAELVSDLAAACAAPLRDYYDAVRAKDWPAANKAADRLIVLVRGAEAQWSARSPHDLKN